MVSSRFVILWCHPDLSAQNHLHEHEVTCFPVNFCHFGDGQLNQNFRIRGLKELVIDSIVQYYILLLTVKRKPVQLPTSNGAVSGRKQKGLVQYTITPSDLIFEGLV